ncbi:MAG: nucleotide exchange factor GrpE [Acidobacteriota bacterium]
MENDNVTTDDGQETGPLLAAELEDSLRSLRARRYELQNAWLASQEGEQDEDEEPSEDEADAEEEVEAEDAEIVEYEIDEAEIRAVEDEAHSVFSEVFEDLHEEVRRMGREMFRTNRASERNQELFDEAINEVRQLSATVAIIPAQHEEAVSAARFETKAELCRELVRMADAFAASLAAVNDLIRQLETKAAQPHHGLAFRFSPAQELSDSLIQSVAAMKQWRDGQQLLAERLQAILRAAGVREIETAGRAFDPEQHRAVSTAPRDDVASGTIVGEELKGYTLEGRILRYPEVIVAKHE